MRMNLRRLSGGLTLLAVLAGTTAGCVPLVIGGAALSGASVVSDRRSSATQLEDQTLEIKAANRIRDVVGERAHVNVTAYNRAVLLTGEIFKEEDRAAIEAAVKRVDNVKSVSVEDLAVAWPSSTADRSNDSLLTAKVRASLVDAAGVSVGAFKVYTDRRVVYLFGRVTEAEAARVIDLARGVQGVQKVVRMVEIITPDELKSILGK
jgi:osmotically-inducible protein OsmY